VLYLGGFVVSHLIADGIGAWPAVLLVAALMGLAALLVADLPASRGAATTG